MRFADALSLATRMFRNRPMRTFLTILGVSVGIGTVLFLVSFGYGLQNVILGQITTEDSLLSLDVNPGVSGLVQITEDKVGEISQFENVSEVSRLASMSSQIVMDDVITDGMVNAVDNSFFRLDGVVPETGKIFDSNDVYQAVISSAGAQLFNLSKEEIIGKKIKLNLFSVRFNEEGFEEIDVVERIEEYEIIGVKDDELESYVFIPLATLSDLNLNSYDRLKVKVLDNGFMTVTRDQLIEKGFLVSSLSDTIDQVNKIFGVVQIVLFSFGFIALVVSAIGMFNTMTIALLERINEIGIMRSIGITRRDIIIMFITEALVMGFMGGVGGSLVGFLAGELVNFFINLLATSLGGRALDLFYSPIWFVGVIIIFSTFVGFFTGVYPSLKASKLNPLDALRYK